MRPFVEGAYHPFVWRDWQAYGSGALGDFGCHIFDPIFTALELTAPLSVKADHAGTNDEIWPGPETVHYVFPGTKWTTSSLKVTWYDGKLRPPRELAQLPPDLDLPRGGSLIIGEGGNMVLPHVAGPRMYPLEKFKEYPYPRDVKGALHWHIWVDHVFENKKTSDGFHYAGPLAETVQLGNVAARFPGKAFEWDAAALQIKGDPNAQKLITKDYRKGYEVTEA